LIIIVKTEITSSINVSNWIDCQLCKKEKVLITGAAGFVGSALSARLIEGGLNSLVLLSRDAIPLESSELFTSRFELAPDSDLHLILKDVGIVVHLAARVHVMNDKSDDFISEYRRDNLDAATNLARQSAASGVKRFIFMSSVKVNGEFTSGDNVFSAEDIPSPQDPYGVSKLEAEMALKKIAEETGMEVVIIRAPLVYGPKVKANFLSMMKWLRKGLPLPFGCIQNCRSLVGLDNLVDLIVTCLDHPKAANQIFMVSDDDDVSTSSLLKEMSAALGCKANLICIPSSLLRMAFFLIGKKSLSQRLLGSLRVDISKTKEMLNWHPPVSFEEGIRRTAEDFLERVD